MQLPGHLSHAIPAPPDLRHQKLEVSAASQVTGGQELGGAPGSRAPGFCALSRTPSRTLVAPPAAYRQLPAGSQITGDALGRAPDGLGWFFLAPGQALGRPLGVLTTCLAAGLNTDPAGWRERRAVGREEALETASDTFHTAPCFGRTRNKGSHTLYLPWILAQRLLHTKDPGGCGVGAHFYPEGTHGYHWRHFWLSQPVHLGGRCYWHQVGGSQGPC